MKFNQTTLDKIEKIAQLSGYVIRYERGTFQSGYCILQEKKVVVLNKFLQAHHAKPHRVRPGIYARQICNGIHFSAPFV